MRCHARDVDALRSSARGAAGLLGLAAPPRCLGCGGLSTGPLDQCLCPSCRGALAGPARRLEPIECVSQARAAVPYGGPALGLVAALKRGSGPAAETMAELIAEGLAPIGAPATLVPVGTTAGRRLRRGVDPAEELAHRLASRLGLGVTRCLRRRDHGRQRGRPRAERIADPPRFVVRGRVPADALVVDDVITTGATLGACARALRAAGSRSVGAVAFAATPPGRSA